MTKRSLAWALAAGAALWAWPAPVSASCDTRCRCSLGQFRSGIGEDGDEGMAVRAAVCRTKKNRLAEDGPECTFRNNQPLCPDPMVWKLLGQDSARKGQWKEQVERGWISKDRDCEGDDEEASKTSANSNLTALGTAESTLLAIDEAVRSFGVELSYFCQDRDLFVIMGGGNCSETIYPKWQVQRIRWEVPAKLNVLRRYKEAVSSLFKDASGQPGKFVLGPKMIQLFQKLNVVRRKIGEGTDKHKLNFKFKAELLPEENASLDEEILSHYQALTEELANTAGEGDAMSLLDRELGEILNHNLKVGERLLQAMLATVKGFEGKSLEQTFEADKAVRKAEQERRERESKIGKDTASKNTISAAAGGDAGLLLDGAAQRAALSERSASGAAEVALGERAGKVEILRAAETPKPAEKLAASEKEKPDLRPRDTEAERSEAALREEARRRAEAEIAEARRRREQIEEQKRSIRDQHDQASRNEEDALGRVHEDTVSGVMANKQARDDNCPEEVDRKNKEDLARAKAEKASARRQAEQLVRDNPDTYHPTYNVENILDP